MSRSQQGGFTLMEVVVALAILAITMTALVKGVGENASNQAYLEKRTLAQWVAFNRIAQLQLNDKPRVLGQTSGVDQMAGRDWHWLSALTTTPDPHVYKVTVEVTPAQVDDEAVVTVVGYLQVIPE